MFRKTILISAIVISGCATTETRIHPDVVPVERFELEIVSVHANGQTRHIKYDRFTGESWWSSNTTWVKIVEPEDIPESVYEVKATATGQSWRAIRIDKVSGKSWKNSQGKWVPFTNQTRQ